MAPLRKLEANLEIKSPAPKFRELIHAKTHQISNISANKVQSCELHEGEWGKVGSIISWKYIHDGKVSVAKDVIEAVDEENNSVTWKIIEGDPLNDYKNLKITIQCIPKDKGSVVHLTFEYEKRHEEIPDSHSLLQLFVDVAKDLDAHLVGLSEDLFATVEAAA